MALVLADRVLETTQVTGTGDANLGGAQANYQPFSVIGDGSTTYYTIVDNTNNSWEVGVGTYVLAGNKITRDTVLSSSNGGALVYFASGAKDIFLDLPSEKVLLTAGDVTGPASAVDSNFAAFNLTTGKLIKDSGYNASTFATAAQGAKADTAVQPGSLGSAAYLNAGSANGVASLDAGGKVPVSQIPALGDLNYQGTWNATTNIPTLVSSAGTKGYYYVVATAGSTNLNGITDWQIGDWAVFNGSVWQKIDNTDAVTSVNGYTGTVVLTAADVSAIPYTGATGAVDLNAKTLVNVANLGVNTTTVPTIKFRAVGDNNSGSRIAMRGYSSDANSSSIRVSKFRGTSGAPQAPISGDSLGKFELAGYGTTASEAYPQVSLEGVTTEVWGATARGAKAVIKVTPNTTITQVTAVTVDQDSKVTLAGALAVTGATTLATSLSGLAKLTSGVVSTATSGTDYAPATSGSSILYGNAAGGFSNVTIGSGVAFAGGTLSATGSGGTVTSVTGTAPVVSSGGATPAISMPAATTSVSGYLTSTDWTTFNNKSNTNGTVTSVAAITLGTTGTDLSSTVATGTTTPVITLQVPTASATNRGALSSTDWSTFNNKGSGTVTSVTGTAPVVSSGGATPAISMAAATTSVNGYLTSTDWTTFNNKTSNTGTVTSIGQTFTGGLISVAGSPVTTTGTLALTVAGTSGGIPYFSSGTTWATSAALAANSLMQGGGAGVAPSTITTGTGVITALGVNTNAAGSFVVYNNGLGTPSSGVVTNLTGTASININGTVGATTPTTGAFTSINTANTFGFKNRIINGAMVIDQRNAGASVTPSNSYTLDRWRVYTSQASKLTTQQNAGAITPPVGFTNYLGITSSSAYAVLTGDYFFINQNIEGFNTADFGWGTANASAITLSFKVYSSLTGTFGGSIENAASTRAYPFSYSIPVANTWTTISITVAGDTTGTWTGATNGVGLQLALSLGTGATYSGTAGAWVNGDFRSVTGATSVVGTSGATFYITGVQLEKGSTATSFDYRPYGTELSLCQRYLPVASAGDPYYGYSYATTASIVGYYFKVTPRVTPTGITTSAMSNFTLTSGVAGTGAPTAITLGLSGTNSCEIAVTNTVGTPTLVAGQGARLSLGASGQILFNGCEL